MVASSSDFRIAACGDTAISVEFGDRIDRELTVRVIALGKRIGDAALEGIVELVPTYRSLLIHFDPLRLPFRRLEAAIRQMIDDLQPAVADSRMWTIPACYEGIAAPDLAEVAGRTGLTPSEVVSIHTEQTYFVYMLGFLPGFPYLGDLPEQLELPRRDTPRIRVPPGSVAIALRMTGIYPLESPGGWHLIANTPVRLFDPDWPEPTLLRPGDCARFAPVSLADFEKLGKDTAAGRFRLKPDGEAT